MIRNINFKKILTFITFFFVVAFPNGFSSKINGLPWTNSIELIIFILIIPLIFLLDRNPFSNYFISRLLIFVFLFKLILLFAPNIGISHKQYLQNENAYNLKINTFETFWNKNLTNFQTYDWNEKKNFPLEWTNYKKDYFPDFFSNTSYKELTLRDEFEFYLYVDDPLFLKIDYNSSIQNQYVEFYEVKNPNYVSRVNLVNNTSNHIELKKGIYKIYGEIIYNGDDFKFLPQLSKDGKNFFSIFKFKNAFSSFSSIQNDIIYMLFYFSSLIFEILFYVLLISLFIKSIFKENSFYENSLMISLSIFLILSFIILNLTFNYFLEFINVIDYFGSWSISVFFICILIIYLINIYFNKNKILNFTFTNKIKNFYILFGPVFLIFWYNYFSDDIHSFSNWTIGDDWWGFQYFSRKIVIDGEWLRAGEDVFYFRPGIRYVFAILHIIFGDSGFAQKMLDVWAIFLTAIIIYVYLIKFNVSDKIAILAPISLLILFSGENYRYLVGRGLSEYFGMFIVMISSLLIYKQILRLDLKLIMICLFLIITPWIREEKIFVSLALIVL